jgi:RHS repeat-associated protein
MDIFRFGALHYINGLFMPLTTKTFYDKSSDAIDRYFYHEAAAAGLSSLDVRIITDMHLTESETSAVLSSPIPGEYSGFHFDVDSYELTRYVNDVNRSNTQVLSEYSASGTLKTKYTYGNERLSTSNAAVSGILGNMDSAYYISDGRGSVAALLGAGGEVLTAYSYGPFGEATSGVSTQDAAYTYNAEEYDPQAALQYLRARYYAPASGRFITADIYPGTLLDPLSQNAYSYAGGDPVNFSDPSGYASILTTIANAAKSAAAAVTTAVKTVVTAAVTAVKTVATAVTNAVSGASATAGGTSSSATKGVNGSVPAAVQNPLPGAATPPIVRVIGTVLAAAYGMQGLDYVYEQTADLNYRINKRVCTTAERVGSGKTVGSAAGKTGVSLKAAALDFSDVIKNKYDAILNALSNNEWLIDQRIADFYNAEGVGDWNKIQSDLETLNIRHNALYAELMRVYNNPYFDSAKHDTLPAAADYLASQNYPTGSWNGPIISNGTKIADIAIGEFIPWNIDYKDTDEYTKYGGESRVDWCGSFAQWVVESALNRSLITTDGKVFNGAWAPNWDDDAPDSFTDIPEGTTYNKYVKGESVLRPGDILVIDNNNNGGTDHVNIYIGDGQIIGGNQGDKGATGFRNITSDNVDNFRVLGYLRFD